MSFGRRQLGALGGYFNEANIAFFRQIVAQYPTWESVPVEGEQLTRAYNYETYGMMRANVALYDAWRAPSAAEWYRILTTHPVWGASEAAPENTSGDAGNVFRYRPMTQDEVIYGYYRAQKANVLQSLREISDAAELPGFDWTPCQIQAMKWEYDDQIAHGRTPTSIWTHSQPFSDLIYLPLKCAAEQTGNEIFAAAAENTAPGTEFYTEWAGLGDRLHSDFRKRSMGRLLTVLAVIAGGYYAGAASGGGSAATGGAAAGTTASVSGAELAALVEAGTVGTEGAFLEAAALSGASVTYNTATGAILGAVLPSGATVAFDPALDAFTQFGVDPSQMALPDTPSGVADAITDAAQQVGEEIAGELVQLGEQEIQRAIEAEIAEAVLGEPQQTGTGTSAGGAAPGYYDYYQPYEPGGPSEYQLEPGGLPPGNVSATLSRAVKPLALGAGLAMLALFVLGDDERK